MTSVYAFHLCSLSFHILKKQEISYFTELCRVGGQGLGADVNSDCFRGSSLTLPMSSAHQREGQATWNTQSQDPEHFLFPALQTLSVVSLSGPLLPCALMISKEGSNCEV
jgi:hypothetical protein